MFAKQIINAGDLIEVCPVIEFAETELIDSNSEILESHTFSFGDNVAIALGYGALYNDSRGEIEPNAQYSKHLEEAQICFYAISEIKANEEIIVDYTNGGA